VGRLASRRVAVALALVGIAIAGYLTYVHYAGLDPACTTGGCEKVQSSSYSELLGLPVATLGLAAYLAILGALWLPGEAGRAVPCFVAIAGFGYSVYLTYLELFEIDAICQWCVGSAVVMTLLAVVTTTRWLRSA
jgi:uncharacterized membrane protein